MKSGSAPGAAELILDLGAGGCPSSSRGVRGSWLQLGTRGGSKHGPAYIDPYAGPAWWTNGQGLAVTCYLCSLQTRDAWLNSLPCGGIEVCDLILLSPPSCPWGVMHAELGRQILTAAQRLLMQGEHYLA